MSTSATANALASALAAVEATLPALEEAAKNHANALKNANELGVGAIRRQDIIYGARGITGAVIAYHDKLSRFYDPRVIAQDGGGGK